MAKYDEGDGVWRTIGGRKVFIREGQSISSAMKESGKFKPATKGKSDKAKIDTDDKEGKRLAENTRQAKLEYEMAQDKYEHYRFDDSDRAKELRQAYNDASDRYTKATREEGEYLAKGSSKEFAKEFMQDKFKAFDKGDISGAELEEAKKNSGLSKAELEEARKYVNNRAPESYPRATENKTGNTTSQPVPNKLSDFGDTYEDYKKMRLYEPDPKNDNDMKKINEMDKKYKEKFEKEKSRAVKYRDEYAIIENGGIQKTFKAPQEAEDYIKSQKNESLEDRVKRGIAGNQSDLVGKDREEQKAINKEYLKQSDIAKEKTETTNNINEELRKQVKSRIWAEKTLNEQYNNSDRQGKKELTDYFNQQLRKQKELENKYGKVSEEDFNKMRSDIYKESEEYKKSQEKNLSDTLRRKAYEKYLKEHPASKMKFEDFIK